MNTGPAMKRNRAGARETLLPVTSPGSRSGVPWTGEREAATAQNARARGVLPLPGTSSTSACPSARRAIVSGAAASSPPTTARAPSAPCARRPRPPSSGPSEPLRLLAGRPPRRGPRAHRGRPRRRQDAPRPGLRARARPRRSGASRARPTCCRRDVTGASVLDEAGAGCPASCPGPVFTNVLLVDEINRATPRTQAALLEAMQERQVSVGGRHAPLPDPFLVLATQNPIEYEGTFALPEAAARPVPRPAPDRLSGRRRRSGAIAAPLRRPRRAARRGAGRSWPPERIAALREGPAASASPTSSPTYLVAIVAATRERRRP